MELYLDATINAKYLTQIFKPIKMFDRLTFEICEKKLEIHGMDGGRVCIIIINIKRQYFNTYKFYKKDKFVISTNIFGNFTNELKGLINFKIFNNDVMLSNNDSTLSLNKHDVDSDNDFNFIHEYNNFIKVPLKEIRKISMGVNKYKCKKVKINSSKEYVKFTFSSKELSVSKKIKNHQQFKTPFVIVVNAKIFTTATKMFNFGENITFYHSHDYPLCIEYNLTKDGVSLKHEKDGKNVVGFCSIIKNGNRKVKKSLDIPIDVYIYIFSYINVFDIFNFCTTHSKYWHIFSKYNCILWKILLKRDFGEDPKKITKCLKSRYMYIKGCGYIRIYIAPLLKDDII